MRKHTRETDLKYFNGDVLVLTSGKKWLVTRLHQPVKPQAHYYSAKDMETGRLCYIHGHHIDELATDKLLDEI